MVPLTLGLSAARVGLGALNNAYGTKDVTKYRPTTSFFGDVSRAGSISGLNAGFDFNPNEYTTTEQTGFGKAMNIVLPTLDAGIGMSSMFGGGEGGNEGGSGPSENKLNRQLARTERREERSLDKMFGKFGIYIPKAQGGLYFNQKANKIRKSERDNPDGSVSTHLMATETFDGKNWVSFPTLFPKDVNGLSRDPKDWIEIKDRKQAYKEAVKRDEVFDFRFDKQSALKFGEGNWKPDERKELNLTVDPADGMNKVALETAEDYFTNPNSNLILAPQRKIDEIKKKNNFEGGGVVTPEGDKALKEYNELKDFVEIARQAIGTNDKETLSKLKFNKPYNSNDLAKDFSRLQQLRQKAGLGIKEESSILFPHIGQQIRGSFNSAFNTHFKDGGIIGSANTGINSVKKINGPSHEQGGVDKVLNGEPVEVEGGEYQLNFKDGSKAVFNKEQMEMYKNGTPISEIIQTMPKENVMGKYGMMIKKKAYNGLLIDPSTYNTEDPFEIPYTFGQATKYPGKGFNSGIKSGVQPLNPESPTLDMTGYEPSSVDTGGGSTKSSPVNFFDQYKKNLGISTVGAIGMQLGQAFQTMSDMKKNLSEEAPAGVDSIKQRMVTPRFTNVKPGLNRIERGFGDALNMSKLLGRPEMIPELLKSKFDVGEKYTTNVNQANLQEGARADNINIQTGMQIDSANSQIARNNQLDKLRFDTIKSQVRGGNIDSLYKTLAGMMSTGGQYGQNKLSADIMEYLQANLSEQQFAQVLGLIRPQ